MKRLKRALWMSLVVAVLLPGAFVQGADIDLVALTQETQMMSQTPDEMNLVWWVPEEYWKASIEQTPGMTSTLVEEFLKVIHIPWL